MSQPKGDDSRDPHEWFEEYVSAFVRDRCTCVYCGFQATTYSAWRQLVVDHFIPDAAGGETSARNYVVSCYRCNQFKGGYDPSEGRYTFLPPEEKERTALVKKARAEIEKREKDQGRPGFYRFIMQEISRLKA